MRTAAPFADQQQVVARKRFLLVLKCNCLFTTLIATPAFLGCTVITMNLKNRAALLISALVLAPPAWAQDIQVRVVSARNGKPITHECLNISLGTWHGAELFAQTNSDGAVVLHVEGGQVTV